MAATVKFPKEMSDIDSQRKERVASTPEAFTGHRCPHSFTECITTIFKDEVILSLQ